MPRSLLGRLADRSRHTLLIAFAIALACAVPVLAANSSGSGNTGGIAATSVASTKPSGLAAGDVMIASVSVRSNTATTVTAAVAGWTQVGTTRTTTSGNPDTQLSTFWKVADATDAAASNGDPSFTFNLNPPVTGSPAHVGIARYDDVAVTSGTPIEASVTNPTSDGASQNNPVRASSVTTTQPGSYVHAIYAIDDDATLSTPTGMTATGLYNNAQATGVQGRLQAFDVSQPAAGASGNKDSTASANVAWVTQTLALKPKPTKLGFSTPARTGVVNDCLGPITVQTENTAGVAVNPLADTDVNIGTDGGTSGAGAFYTASDCQGGTITQGQIQTNQTSFTFYYKPTDRGDGSHTITATATGLTQATQDQTVKLAQTIDWPDVLPPSAIYGDSFGVGSATASSGLPVTITPSGGCSLAGSNATMSSGSTDCTLTASQAGDSTYAAAPNVGPRTVNADLRAIEVTADPNQTKVYSGTSSTDPTLTYSITSGSLAFTDTFSGALARAAGETVAGSPYAITQGTLSLSASNYDLTFIGDDFTITPAPLTVDANNRQKTYGGIEPTLTYALNGFVNGENKNSANVTGDASCSRDPGETVAGSPYTITCTPGTLAAPNYSFATGATADFTINPAQLAVDADPASKTYGDADPAFTATLTGFVNSEDATSAGVTGAAACTRPGVGTDEDANTYTGAISCAPGTLAAANYTFTTGNPADFTINTRTAHATFTVDDKVYDRTTAANVTGQSLANRAPGETATEIDLTGTPGPAAFSDSNAGTNKTVNVDPGSLALTGTEVSNYTLVVDDGTADITQKPVDGSFIAADKVYNGTTAATVTSRSVDAADVISPDVVTLTGGAANFANPNVGPGKTVTLTGASLGGADGANYKVGTIATDTASITKRNVTGSFTAADKDYDGTRAATITSRSLSNAIAGDAVALTGGTATFSDPNPGVDKAVTGTGFVLGGADAANYNLTGVGTTTATIQRQPGGSTPPPPSVEDEAEKALGGPVKELPFDLNGLGYAFAPADQTGTLKVGKRAIKLFAIGGCDNPCSVKAVKTLVLIGTADGASAAAKTRKIKLGTQRLSLAAGEFGVIKLNKLTRKQRKAIRRAQKSKLVVKTTLTSAGQSVTFKKKYRLKLKRG